MPLIISNKNPVKIKWVKIAYEFNKNFEEISKFKSNKQCKERWWNHLNPSTNKKPFSLEEDLILLEKSLVLGTKWAKILKFLEGRNQHQIKNRFTALVSDINQVSKEKIRDLIKTNKVENLAQKTLDYLKQYQNLLETGKKREEEIKKKFEMSGIFLKE